MENIKSKERVSSLVSRLDKVAFAILVALVFLLPVFFIPSLSVPFQLMKMIMLVVGVLVTFLLWLVARIKEGVISFPRTFVLLFAVLIPISFFVSALTIDQKVSLPTAFLGQGGELGTVGAMIILSLSMFLVIMIVRSKSRIKSIFVALFSAIAVVSIFEIIRFIPGTNYLSFGIFTDKALNLIGKWNELGIFFGISLILLMLTLETLAMKKTSKILIWIAYTISLALFLVVNFGLSLYVIGLVSLFLFVYLYVFNKQVLVKVADSDVESLPKNTSDIKTRFPISPIITFVIVLVFIIDGFIAGAPVHSKLFQKFQVNQVEVSLPWSATIDVTQSSLKADPVFGIGPNRFINRYLVSKPLSINNSDFWGVDFNYATGLLPSFVVTSGLIGTVAWLLFLVSFFYLGFKYLLLGASTNRYLTVSSFLISGYLWLISIFYVPNIVLFAFAFMFSGLFIATLVQEKTIKTSSIGFLKNPKVGFVSVLVLVLIIIITLVGLYKYSQRFISGYYFQKSLVDLNVNSDIISAEMNMLKAVDHSRLDLYYRSLAELNLFKIDRLFATTSTNKELNTQLLSQFSIDAFNNAKEAKLVDPLNYQNDASLARIYEFFVPLGDTAAYQAATSVYLEAVKLNPGNPALFLTLARLEITNKKLDEAKKYIAKALEIKANYGEALFLRSQIEATNGDIKSAIATMISVASLYPSDPNVFFELGKLQYANKDYVSAMPSFERAVILNQYYSNARYFLGLTYSNLDKDDYAITQFEIIKKIDPNSKGEVDPIITNIKAGRAPLSKPVVKTETTKKK